jgi:hypothetical protein
MSRLTGCQALPTHCALPVTFRSRLLFFGDVFRQALRQADGINPAGEPVFLWSNEMHVEGATRDRAQPDNIESPTYNGVAKMPGQPIKWSHAPSKLGSRVLR